MLDEHKFFGNSHYLTFALHSPIAYVYLPTSQSTRWRTIQGIPSQVPEIGERRETQRSSAFSAFSKAMISATR